MSTSNNVVKQLANELSLGSLMAAVLARFGRYELVDHWTQGEFHHDVVLRIPDGKRELPGAILIVATNCNGGVKEVLCFDTVPDRNALWSWRCPAVDEFAGGAPLPPVLERATTTHWFDPCELLRPDARSELREEFRERQVGGGWQMSPSACGTKQRD